MGDSDLKCGNCFVELLSGSGLDPNLTDDQRKRCRATGILGNVTNTNPNQSESLDKGTATPKLIPFSTALNYILHLPPENVWTHHIAFCMECAEVVTNIFIFHNLLQRKAKPQARLTYVLNQINKTIRRDMLEKIVIKKGVRYLLLSPNPSLKPTIPPETVPVIVRTESLAPNKSDKPLPTPASPVMVDLENEENEPFGEDIWDNLPSPIPLPNLSPLPSPSPATTTSQSSTNTSLTPATPITTAVYCPSQPASFTTPRSTLVRASLIMTQRLVRPTTPCSHIVPATRSMTQRLVRPTTTTAAKGFTPQPFLYTTVQCSRLSVPTVAALTRRPPTPGSSPNLPPLPTNLELAINAVATDTQAPDPPRKKKRKRKKPVAQAEDCSNAPKTETVPDPVPDPAVPISQETLEKGRRRGGSSHYII